MLHLLPFDVFKIVLDFVGDHTGYVRIAKLIYAAPNNPRHMGC